MKLVNRIISFLMLTIMTTTILVILNTNVYATTNLSSNYRKINKVGVLLYNFEDMYMSKLKENLEEIQKKNPVSFTFFDAKQNKAIQNEIINYLLNNKFDLLLLSLITPTKDEVAEIINVAKQKNIPLIIFNIGSPIISQVKDIYDKAAFITSDSYKLGTLEGKILAAEWASDKSVIDKNNDNVLQYVILQGRTTTSIPLIRSNSAISAIENSSIKTELLELIIAYWDKELAKNAIDSLFLKYGSKIEAIISNNDAMAIGAVEALQKYGYNTGDKLKYIPIVGIDGLQEAKDLIDKGFMTGTVTQSPSIIAEALYTIGLNLISNVNPIENTDYKITNGEIIIPENYQEYIKQ